MEVIIAGYNKTVDGFSPEVISASYARTSRSEKIIPEIREEAKVDVEKARQSNTNIVFGIGHATIAEHVVFNIDIMDVSRFLVEEIESHRLASYTEKSQRYVLFKGDYTIPLELNETVKKEFIDLIEEQNNFYQELYPVLLEYFKNKNPEKYENDKKTVEGWAKEDARYIISMATQTQLGMTINARNLELLIRRLNACPYIESRQLAKMLYDKVYEISPSLFPYTNPSSLEFKNKGRLFESNSFDKTRLCSKKNVQLISYTKFADYRLAQSFGSGRLMFDKSNSKGIILERLEGMEPFDSAPREFEVIDFQFILQISSSCFAQLKRHRMMTILPRPYQTWYSVVIPKSVQETKMTKKFKEIIKKTNDFYNKYETPYCLTNSHTRFVQVKVNLREMYHFCRMRMDNHAQWEIRELANEMHKLASKVCPNGMSLCCGKDQFKETYEKIFESKK
jgi:flavin-dependent thymidylate synthase